MIHSRISKDISIRFSYPSQPPTFLFQVNVILPIKNNPHFPILIISGMFSGRDSHFIYIYIYWCIPLYLYCGETNSTHHPAGLWDDLNPHGEQDGHSTIYPIVVYIVVYPYILLWYSLKKRNDFTLPGDPTTILCII